MDSGKERACTPPTKRKHRPSVALGLWIIKRLEKRNDTTGTRVVLFLDVERPLNARGTLLNRFVLRLIRWSPFIQDARRNQRAWERGLEP
jgi:hypothetical protein